jgi:hypothetical protein
MVMRIDEARQPRAEHPGGAQDGKPAPGGMDAVFPGKLGPAIAAQRPGGVIRLPGAGAAAVENIVCRYVQKRKAARCCRLRHPCRGRGVDPHRHVFVAFSLIHRRVGGCVDHNFGVAGGNRIGASVRFAQIGVDFVTGDGTNLGTPSPFADAIQNRPLEVLMEEFIALRAQGIPTPAVASWQRSTTGCTLWQNILDLYNNDTYAQVVYRDPATGKKVFFVPDSPDPTIVAQIQSNGFGGVVTNTTVPLPIYEGGTFIYSTPTGRKSATTQTLTVLLNGTNGLNVNILVLGS